LDDAGQHRVEVIGFSNPMFPPRLRQIPDPPVIIYVKGSMDCLLAPSLIAVVGTRSPSPYGEKCAKRFGFRLAEKGIGVVSGLAIGCDTAAHTGCLAANGQTIAVLAHGLDTVSPARNRDLASQIQDANGSLVSEYPIGTPARRNSFVDRDRLQIGLSDGLLVVETGVKGGTMHTVKYCGEQEKPLACLDHPLDYQPHQKSAGNQMLIKDGKAFPLSVAGDLLTFIDQLKNRENN
jgi:DNA processing protein